MHQFAPAQKRESPAILGWHSLTLGAEIHEAYCGIMLVPLKCPVCGRSSIEPVLETVKVVASYVQFQGDIGGLQVYRCTEHGHIFFVRSSDLETSDAELLTHKGSRQTAH